MTLKVVQRCEISSSVSGAMGWISNGVTMKVVQSYKISTSVSAVMGMD